MDGMDFVEADQWLLSPYIGSDHPFWRINSSTIIYTWIMLGLLVLFLVPLRIMLRRKQSMIRHAALSFAQFFIDLCKQTLPYFSFNHFVFVVTTFCFVLSCNLLAVFPFMEEPTTDLNTTLACGLIAFLYTQAAVIKENGLWPYAKGYFTPVFIMLPLNLVGKFASVLSISFRLFGNIFGGSIITNLWFGIVKKSIILELIGIFTGMNLLIMLFFNVFEGFLQAFVFAMLSLTYLGLGLQGEGH